MDAWIWMVSLTLGTGPHWSVPLPQQAAHCPELRAPFERIVEAPSNQRITAQPPLSSPLRFELRAGRLKPQLERLLSEAFAIQHVVWQAPEGLQWTTDYQLSGNDWHSMLEAILRPYQLQLSLYANHTAVVSLQAEGATL